MMIRRKEKRTHTHKKDVDGEKELDGGQTGLTGPQKETVHCYASDGYALFCSQMPYKSLSPKRYHSRRTRHIFASIRHAVNTAISKTAQEGEKQDCLVDIGGLTFKRTESLRHFG